MAYNGYVTTIKNLRKHPNADRLQLGECFGNTVCVSMEYRDNQIGIYFPTDGQLSEEFCNYNNLVRKKDENGVNVGGYMDPGKRNVTSIKLRGEKSDGLFMPIGSLDFTGVDTSTLKVGDTITVINGHEICKKYIPRGKTLNRKTGNKTRKKRTPIAPLFIEHADTEQLAYNLNAFKYGDQIEITLKMHGTSQRTAYLPVLKGFKKTLLDRILRREGTPVYDWGYVTGTRRTVLDNYDGGYYGNDEFRKQHADFFEGKLLKGEEVYYEVVGFITTGAPIMGTVDNKKTNDKDFIKQYGKTTTFSYGCDVPNSDFYVYRMTMTNEDGDIVEYTPDYMRYRCEQMGCKCVPVFWKGFLEGFSECSAGYVAKNIAEQFYDGPDPVGKNHVREGVVVRIINRPKFTAYKHKNFSFKCLEGIVKAEADAPDMEEAQEVENEEETS